ncbi:beta-glucosidase [Malassezia arunalokei]|jgi:cyclin, N-terminal domain|uniref:Beta-glucosidase n=1 Tax=Malassezia arunalokei TaxID=1514897 RepID=A0AAJ5YXJ9_9BASI|nr:beta-glucosidase [Malassezia arunalokei]
MADRKAKVATVTDTLYFTPAQWDGCMARMRGDKLSALKWNQMQMAACSFIAAVGAKLGCPQRTMGTAQLLYQRFHLFHAPTDFSLHEVALTCLFTSAKLNDTQKRVHEVVLASYVFRYPELISTPDRGDWIAHAHVSDVDQEMLHREQAAIVSLERLLLPCLCYNFQLRSPQILSWTIKLARHWRLSKSDADVAWRMACDSHRTNVAWLYTPLTVALGCLYAQEAMAPGAPYPWHETASWGVALSDVTEVALKLLQLYVQHTPALYMSARSERRVVPPHAVYPPPLGLLTWRAPTASEMEARLTQAQIYLRQKPLDERVPPPRSSDALLPPRPTHDGARVIATRYILPI